MKRTVYGNGKIYTVDKDLPWAEAFCVEGKKIVCVGTDAEVREKAGADAEYIDLEGKMALPGFIDSHIHALAGAQELLFKVNLADAASREECLETVKNFYQEHPDISFLEGAGWINPHFDERGPRKEWLDEITTEIPIVLDSGDHHSIWANSKAIEMAGVTKNTTIDGGVLEIDPKTGELSGTFREQAQAPFQAIKPVYSVEKVKEAVRYLEKLMGSLGITMVHDPMVELHSNDIKAYAAIDRDGVLALKVRGSLMTRPETIEELRDQYVPAREECNKGGNFQVHSIKVLLDGVIEGATAYLKAPYAHRPDYRSEPIWPDGMLKNHFKWAEANGFQTHSHVIGDAAVAHMLDALEFSAKENGKPNIRPIAAHMQIVDRADYARLKAQGIIVSANPYWFAKEQGYFYNLELPYLGEERAEHEYPMKSLMDDAGLRIASGSDFPVTFPPAPLTAIQMGMTRCDFHDDITNPANVLNKEEAVSLETMIESFTINGAYANFAEDITGSITAGKFADFVVLGQNIFDVPVDEIYQIPILMTVAEGKVIYHASAD